VISPLLSNLYLNEIDRMLEKAIQTPDGIIYPCSIRSFADDMVILNRLPSATCLAGKGGGTATARGVGQTQSGDKRREKQIVDLANGGSFTFLGFEYRRILGRNRKWRPYYAPKLKKRTALLAKLKEIFRQISASRWRGWSSRSTRSFAVG